MEEFSSNRPVISFAFWDSFPFLYSPFILFPPMHFTPLSSILFHFCHPFLFLWRPFPSVPLISLPFPFLSTFIFFCSLFPSIAILYLSFSSTSFLFSSPLLSSPLPSAFLLIMLPWQFFTSSIVYLLSLGLFPLRCHWWPSLRGYKPQEKRIQHVYIEHRWYKVHSVLTKGPVSQPIHRCLFSLAQVSNVVLFTRLTWFQRKKLKLRTLALCVVRAVRIRGDWQKTKECA